MTAIVSTTYIQTELFQKPLFDLRGPQKNGYFHNKILKIDRLRSLSTLIIRSKLIMLERINEIVIISKSTLFDNSGL